MYYLETNSLRSQLPKLGNKEFVKNSFTSVLSLMEIISGINRTSELHKRKNILKKVLKSDIFINYELPEGRLLKAFGLLQIPSYETEILGVINVILSTDIFEDVYKKMENSKLLFFWDFLRDFDNNAPEIFMSAFTGKTNEFRNNIQTNSGPEFYQNKWGNCSEESHRNEILKVAIDNHARSLSINNQVNPKGTSFENLVNAYDGSCNNYFLLISYYADLKVILGNEPGKNDYFDLGHFNYIENPFNIIVSDDKMINKVCSKIAPMQIVKSNEL